MKNRKGGKSRRFRGNFFFFLETSMIHCIFFHFDETNFHSCLSGTGPGQSEVSQVFRVRKTLVVLLSTKEGRE